MIVTEAIASVRIARLPDIKTVDYWYQLKRCKESILAVEEQILKEAKLPLVIIENVERQYGFKVHANGVLGVHGSQAAPRTITDEALIQYGLIADAEVIKKYMNKGELSIDRYRYINDHRLFLLAGLESAMKLALEKIKENPVQTKLGGI